MTHLSSFGAKYSEFYDLLYSDKNYESECDYIERIFKLRSSRNIRKIVDIACGTGGHAIPLAKRGYSVLGADISEYMLAQARKKVVAEGLDNRLHVTKGDMRYPIPIGRFDACLCMFAAIGYLSRYEDVLAALRAMHRYLRPKGLLVFDFWNGIAVLTMGPSKRTKRVSKNDLTVERNANPRLEAQHNICKVKYTLTITRRGYPKQTFSETHTMRYFFPDEMRLLLKLAGFNLVSLHPFLRPKAIVHNRDWNITAIARKS